MRKREQLKEFTKLGKGDLQRLLKEKQENLRGFRFDLAGGKIKDISLIRETRKSVSRIKTLLNKK
ncbi:MAG: 50S ribosomal protein L29 [Candidatus Pacebacteria bacterium]|nr:50S ribosomal protein L29 [Candidatus Paceibacterota bacterium]